MRLRHLLLAALVALACGPLGAATFTATGTSSDVQVTPGNTLSVALSGSWVATVNIERKVGSAGYQPLYVAQSNATYTLSDPGTYHLNCIAFTSGTVTYTITAPAGYQVNYRAPSGASVFSVDNNGVVAGALSTATVTGGTVDATPIGSVTPSTGAFTTLTSNAATTFTAGTVSTTTGTGTVVITGGEGLSGDLNVGGVIAGAGTIRRNGSANTDVCFATYYTGATFAFFAAADGTLNWGPSSSGVDTFLTRNGVGQLLASANTASTSTTTGGLVLTGGEGIGGALNVGGNIAMTVAGSGLKVKEGTNARMGTATLVAGAATVSNTSVTASTRIFLESNADGGTPGWLRVSARVASTSFTITSSSGTDTSTVAWVLVEPSP